MTVSLYSRQQNGPDYIFKQTSISTVMPLFNVIQIEQLTCSATISSIASVGPSHEFIHKLFIKFKKTSSPDSDSLNFCIRPR